MDIKSIVHQIFQCVIPATILACIIAAMAGVCYFVFYKKLFKGNKTIGKTKVIFGALIIIYLLVLFGLTSMDRWPGMSMHTNFKLFSSYIEAWNTFTVRAWQFIIFNIIMFIPLGILLPLINRKFTKVRWILTATFLTTLFIEVFQLLTGRGIFELDDLFHNTLGGMIGYCLYMFGYRAITGTRKNEINTNNHAHGTSKVKFLILPITVTAIFIGIFVKYNLQEFGNMPLRQVSGADMSKYTIESTTDISNKEAVAPVYKYVHSWDKEYGISQAQKVMKDLNLPNYTGYDVEGEDIIFKFENGSFWWDISNGSWRYRNSHSDTQNKSLTKNNDEKYKIAIDFAKSHNISLVNSTLDSNENNNITFKINADTNNKSEMRSGQIIFYFTDDGVIDRISHAVYVNEFVRNVNIISPQSAYQKVLKGNFNDWPDIPCGKIEINEVKISYSYDTKGFFQPVYEFNGTLNGGKWSTRIVAMK
ncbi:MAG: VanZ family protein [Bacillota bacterium]|nr:VanZ family protein [Bacillota bacterium]